MKIILKFSLLLLQFLLSTAQLTSFDIEFIHRIPDSISHSVIYHLEQHSLLNLWLSNSYLHQQMKRLDISPSSILCIGLSKTRKKMKFCNFDRKPKFKALTGVKRDPDLQQIEQELHKLHKVYLNVQTFEELGISTLTSPLLEQVYIQILPQLFNTWTAAVNLAIKLNDQFMVSMVYYDENPLISQLIIDDETELVLSMLDKGVNVDVVDDLERSPLHLACLTGNLRLANRFLQSKLFDVNARDKDFLTPLMSASVLGDLNLIKALIDAGAQVNLQFPSGDTAFIIASKIGHAHVFPTFIDSNADLTITDKHGNNALMAAVRSNHIDAISVLLNQSVPLDVQNDSGSTALLIACMNWFEPIAELLLSKGANHNLVDVAGWTPLMAASFHGLTSIVDKILKLIPEVDQVNNEGKTALLLAAVEGYSTVIDLLLKSGANINHQDSFGITALMYASLAGHASTVNLLLSNNANISITCDIGRTAAVYAHYAGHDNIVYEIENRINE